MARMLRDDIIKWLDENGGQKGDYVVETESIDNPKWEPGSTSQPRKLTRKKMTWYSNNGKMITVIDDSEDTSRPRTADGMLEGDVADEGGVGRKPSYDVDYQGPVPKDDKINPPSNTNDNRSPERRKQDQAEAAEAEWNRANGPVPDKTSPAYKEEDAGRGSGRFETHSEREKRERDEEAARRATRAEEDRQEEQKRRREADDKANALREKELEIAQARADSEDRARALTDSRERDRIGIERDRLQAEKDKANRPAVIGSPTDETRRIIQQNPDGSVSYIDNPAYDEIKAKTKEKREQLRDAIAHNQMTAAVASQKYKEWYDAEVAIPLARAKEERERAAESREAQKAADEERRFAAKYEIDKANVGQQAAESAQANERALLPYRVGPKFGGQFSSAVNGLSGSMDKDSSAGVKFTADAFEFKRPDFAGIARNATRDALKHLTPYEPTDVSKYAVGNYEGIRLPTDASTGATAPPSASYIDTSQYLTPPE